MPLFVVATPIGNLEDLTLRAIRVLGEVDAVVAEDTRRTRGLLSHLGLSKPLLSLPAFDEKARVAPLAARLAAGESFALVTDAGTPAVSDPGGALVEAAWEAGVDVVPVPGCSAALAAVSVCGLDASRFFFAGFLPRKGRARSVALDELGQLRTAFVVFEAGNRTGTTLAELAARFGPRRALVARELTKMHEQLARGLLGELADQFQDGARGEVVIVVEGASENAAPEEALDTAITRLLAEGEKLTSIARQLAASHSRPRQEVYAQAMAIRDGAPEDDETGDE